METVKQNKQLMEIWDTEENEKQNIFPENISLGSSKIKINVVKVRSLLYNEHQ